MRWVSRRDPPRGDRQELPAWRGDPMGLEALWRQKWSQRFDTSLQPDWASEAPWMAHFKDD